MRLWEELSYVFGIGLAISYGLEHYLASLILMSLTGLALIIGAFVEGYRFPQWVFIIAFVAQIVLVVLAVFSIVALCIYSVFLAYAIVVTIIFGEGNMDKLKMTGPYEVGYKKIYTSKDDLTVHVYYPMDKEAYKEIIDQKGRNPAWLVDPNSRDGVAKATANWGEEEGSHPWMFKYLDAATLNCALDGPIHEDFEKKDLVPIVYVHGLTCTGTSQSGSCRDFASHGYIVFALDHFDGSCYFSKKRTGEVRIWSSTEAWGEKGHLQKKLAQRKMEITHLVDDIFEPKFV